MGLIALNHVIAVGRGIFADLNEGSEPGIPDGLKVDSIGRVYCTGPGGLWVMAPDGRRIGVIRWPEQAVIAAVGDARAAAATADIVDYDVYAAMGRDGGPDQPGRFIRLADIGRVSGYFRTAPAQLRFRFTQMFSRTRREHQPAALGSKRLGGGKADAAARTGD
jgi:hypothetical protein